MLTIEVELLTGRYAATAYNDRYKAEWPPHPARLFSALVAALHDQEPADVAERNALLWLEQLSPPSLEVDLAAHQRQVHDTYVPVNDVTLVGDPEIGLRAARETRAAISDTATKELKKADAVVAKEEKKLASFVAAQMLPDQDPSNQDLQRAVALLPERRTRQVRTFPVALPGTPTFAFQWQGEASSADIEALKALCSRVTRLGHSSSLVRCSVVERKPDINLVPDPKGDHVLRTVARGQLEQLESAYSHHRGVEQRTLPSRPQRYGPRTREEDAAAPSSVFSDDWIVFRRVGGDRLLSSRTVDLSSAFRAALIEISDGSLPPSLSGHMPNGERASIPHIAFIAPPFVGRKHADGSIQGCAIVMPRSLTKEDRARLLQLVADWEKKRGSRDGLVTLGGKGLPEFTMQRPLDAPPFSLMEQRWCKPSRRYVTATPIALDRNPGNLRSNQDQTAQKAAAEAARFIGEACVNIGLPRPASVEISQAPLLAGAQHSAAYAPRRPAPGRPPRVRVHAEVTFAEPVRGPVLLGAGRYVGLGLCLPVDSQERA